MQNDAVRIVTEAATRRKRKPSKDPREKVCADTSGSLKHKDLISALIVINSVLAVPPVRLFGTNPGFDDRLSPFINILVVRLQFGKLVLGQHVLCLKLK